MCFRRSGGRDARNGDGTAGTWYGQLLDEVDEVLRLVDQIGAHDDRHRPYPSAAEELRAGEFLPVQQAVVDLAARMHGARQSGAMDDGVAYEAMGLLVDLILYMRAAAHASANCTGGFGFLVARIEKLLGAMVITVRSRMGLVNGDAGGPVVAHGDRGGSASPALTDG